MSAYKTVRDLNLGAILCTLGAEVKLDALLDARRGRGMTSMLFPAQSIPEVNVRATKYDPSIVGKSVLQAMLDGTLAEADPEHPAIDCMRALLCKKRILEWLQTGKPCMLIRDGQTQRAIYEPCESLPHSITHYPEQFPCADFKMVVTLSMLGVPICRIGGSHGNHVFYMALRSIVPGIEIFDGRDLVRQARENMLHPEHPFYFGMQVQRNRDELEKRLNGVNPHIHITRLGSARNSSALINPNVDKEALDYQYNLARQHCGGF